MTDPFDKSWGTLMPFVTAASTAANTTLIYLHLPKTGGSTAGTTFREAPGWEVAALPASFLADRGCNCGAEICVDSERRDRIKALTPDDLTGKSLLLKMGHESYEAVEWARARLTSRDDMPPRAVLAVRPVRRRLVSMFTDYWSQVLLADELDAGTVELTPHKCRIVKRYQEDSGYYRDAKGHIDGEAWFKAFGESGGGVPFFLSQAFASTDQLQSEINSGQIMLVPTRGMDDFLMLMTGSILQQRQRVSRPYRPEAVTAALADAAQLIDVLALRDAAYDEIVTQALGHDVFAG